MRRFYQLDMQPDLFGGVLLMKEWGRIGARGRIMAERYDSEALAADALQRQAARKRRRGYDARADALCDAQPPANTLAEHGILI